MRVRWLKNALKNLEAEAIFIAKDNPKAAAEMIAYVMHKVDALCDFPAVGRIGRVQGTRELVINRYHFVIPYRVMDNELHILRVFHSRRKLPLSW